MVELDQICFFIAEPELDQIYTSRPELDQMCTFMAELDQMCCGFGMLVLAELCGFYLHRHG